VSLIDREDLRSFYKEFGLDPAAVRRIAEDVSDQIEIISQLYEIGNSLIEGQGVFARKRMLSGTCVGKARIANKRTPLGRFTNHAKHPNARMLFDGMGNIVMILDRNVDAGEELTVNYRQVARDIQNMVPC
jgi:SET domain-containing protein